MAGAGGRRAPGDHDPDRGPADLGRLFLLAELAVAVVGWGLEINPFDQPNVQQAKDATNRVLAEYEAEAGRARRAVRRSPTRPRCARCCSTRRRPQYVALMAYVEPSPSSTRPPPSCARWSARATGATTTFGYGPRFLHSTGQFHKGGPPVGRFLQLLHDGPQRRRRSPARHTRFTTLKKAQAIGDLQDAARARPARRSGVRLQGDDPAGALRALTATIKEAT